MFKKLGYYITGGPICRTELERVLFVSASFSILLTIIRWNYTGTFMFLWLNWNLFLAFLPFALTRFLQSRPDWIESRIKFFTAFICWLVLLPNAFYIITDLFHLMRRPPVPLWFDLALILSFAWNGLQLGIISLRQMEDLMKARFPRMNTVFFAAVLMILNALGVYIGRYLRYNSWDVLSNPFQLLGDIVYLTIHPLRNFDGWSMIGCYALLMGTIYMTFKKVGDTN
jgi:uncharacterized membrane protein